MTEKAMIAAGIARKPWKSSFRPPRLGAGSGVRGVGGVGGAATTSGASRVAEAAVVGAAPAERPLAAFIRASMPSSSAATRCPLFSRGTMTRSMILLATMSGMEASRP
jgi:hypothetical protein